MINENNFEPKVLLCRSISPSARLQHQNSYCDIDTQGNKALVMKQYLSDDQVKLRI